MEKETIKKERYYLGKCDYLDRGKMDCPAYIEYELKEGENGVEFSASGEIWRADEADIYAGGQNIDVVVSFFPYDKKAKRIAEIWKSYHLNEMKAGLPDQEDFINDLTDNGWKYDYSAACDILKKAGLYEIPIQETDKCTGSFPDDVVSGKRGYRYGERWVYSEIPKEVIQAIMNL